MRDNPIQLSDTAAFGGAQSSNHLALLRRAVDADDDVGAVASASALFASGSEAGQEGERLAERLLKRGFRSAARVLGAHHIVLIATAEDSRPARTSDLNSLAASLDRALMAKAIPAAFLGRAHHARGRLLARAGRLPDAAEAFRKALAHDPTYPLAASDLAEVLLCEGRVDQARGFLELAKSNEDGPRRLVVEASLAELIGDVTAAAVLLDRAASALEAATCTRRFAFAQACRKACIERGLPEDAPLLELLDADAHSAPWPGGEPSLLRKRGAHLADRVGALPEAREHVAHFGDLQRKDVDLAAVAARAALLSGDAEGALRAAVLSESARTPTLATLGGLAMLDLGRRAEGVAVLTASVAEGCPAADVGLAWVAVEDGRLEHADAHLRYAMKSMIPQAVKACIGATRAALRESAGDGLGAVCMLAAALAHEDDPVLRARYVTLTVDMALRAHDDPHARQHFLDRALDAVVGSDIGDDIAAIPVAMAEWMTGRPPRLSVKEIDTALATAASLAAVATRSALRNEDWSRVRSSARRKPGGHTRDEVVDVRRHGILPKTASMADPGSIRRLAITMTRGCA